MLTCWLLACQTVARLSFCGLWMFLAKQMMIVSLAIALTVMKEKPFISKQVQYVINYRLCDGVMCTLEKRGK